MRISSRYVLDIAFMLSAAFLAVWAMAFAPAVISWVAFGVAAGVTVVALGSVLIARRDSRKVGHSMVALIALLTAVIAPLFAGTALTWTVFGLAIAFGVAAIGDLTVHELTTERVVHQLEVIGIQEPTGAPTGRTSA